MQTITNQTFDKERAFYGSKNMEVAGCRFDGPADGESAFKESRDIVARDCFFNLRYPFWHDSNKTTSGVVCGQMWNNHHLSTNSPRGRFTPRT